MPRVTFMGMEAYKLPTFDAPTIANLLKQGYEVHPDEGITLTDFVDHHAQLNKHFAQMSGKELSPSEEAKIRLLAMGGKNISALHKNAYRIY